MKRLLKVLNLKIITAYKEELMVRQNKKFLV